MLFEVLVDLFLFCIILKLYQLRRVRPKGFPPGPFSWPIVGNLPQLGMEPYKSVMTMRKKYGDIIGIDLGTRRAIFINEYNLLKEAFKMPVFVGRPNFHQFADPKTGELRGLGFNSGPNWNEQRRFVFSNIQPGRKVEIMERQVKKEVSELVENLKKSCGISTNTRHAFNISVINTLWVMVTGKRFSINDEDFLNMMRYTSNISSSPLTQGIHLFFPQFSKMFPTISGFKYIKNNFSSMLEFTKNICKEHKETYREGAERDVVDSYIQKIKSTIDPNSSFYRESGERNLEHCLTDLMFAGADTVSSALCWLVFLMAHYPEVQKKFISEITRRRNLSDEHLSLKDRTSLPYIEAVIHEVLRFSSFVPLGVFHETLDDVNFHGFKIPKGTIVAANQYGIMHDPDIWGDPENFRPERFLSEDGSAVIHHPAFVAFSVGRRSCPGEAFGRDEIFLFVTGLFQNFSVEFDPSIPIPQVKCELGFINFPTDHRIIFHRNSL